MKAIKNIEELAGIFYDRLMDDMELNGKYDENDPCIKLSDEISKMISEAMDYRTANALEDKVFELSDMYDKEYYVKGFETGVEVAYAVLMHCSDVKTFDYFSK